MHRFACIRWHMPLHSQIPSICFHGNFSSVLENIYNQCNRAPICQICAHYCISKDVFVRIHAYVQVRTCECLYVVCASAHVCTLELAPRNFVRRRITPARQLHLSLSFHIDLSFNYWNLLPRK